MTIAEISKLLEERKVSSRELVTDIFLRIGADNPHNSFITATKEEALAQAEVLDGERSKGRVRGPLHGIPIAHKDNFHTRGLRTTAGSLIYRDFIPSHNADVVQRLEAAGCISIGKTNMHELAFGITSKNPHYGFVRNPLDPTRIAGGSSGGSAALITAGFIPAATGTDTGGSLRIPASYCGIVGFKPTYGRVSRRGIVPLSFSLDAAGPLGATAADCAALFAAMVDRPRSQPFTPHRLRIGTAREYFADVEVKVSASYPEANLPALTEMNAVARIVQLAETSALYSHRRDGRLFGADVWALIEQGRQLAAHEYVNAQRLRGVYRRQMLKVWREFDLLLTPTTPITAPLIASDTVTVQGHQEDIRIASTRLVRSFNLLGCPALSMPWGTDSHGMPIGLQLIAAPGRDEWLLAAAAHLQERAEENHLES